MKLLILLMAISGCSARINLAERESKELHRLRLTDKDIAMLSIAIFSTACGFYHIDHNYKWR